MWLGSRQTYAGHNHAAVGRCGNFDAAMNLEIRVRQLLQLTAWGSVLSLVVLSLIPKELEMRTNLAGTLEHAIAYALTSSIIAVAYPAVRRLWIVVALFALSGILELLQNFVPGRNPEMAGAIFSGVGAAAGGFLVSLVASFRRRRAAPFGRSGE